MKFTRKITASILATVIMFGGTGILNTVGSGTSGTAISASAEEELLEYQNFLYTETNNGVAIVFFCPDEYLGENYMEDDTKLIFPEEIDGKPVTIIGSGADAESIFQARIDGGNINTMSGSEVKSVVIPESVTNISDYAFYGYDKLESVTISNGVKRIGKSAFSDTGLTEVNIPDSVVFIGDSAFMKTGLTEITIPDTVTSIGDKAIGYDAEYTNSNLYLSNPKKVREFKINCGEGSIAEQYAIDNKFVYQLTNGSKELNNTFVYQENESDSSAITVSYNGEGGDVEIPREIDGKTVKGINGFNDITTLTSLIIPDTVTGYINLSGCTNLKSVKLPNNIENFNFANCESLTEINIPDGISEINGAFKNCKSLKEIIIPTGVKTLYGGAFSGCENLESVTILNNEMYIDEDSFADCPKLTIYCGSGSTAEEIALSCGINYETIDVSAFIASQNDKSSQDISEVDSVSEESAPTTAEANVDIEDNDNRTDVSEKDKNKSQDKDDDEEDDSEGFGGAQLIIIIVGIIAIVVVAVISFRGKSIKNQVVVGKTDDNRCANCGNELNEGAVFCRKCGSKVNGTISAPKTKNNKSKKIFGIVSVFVIILAVILLLAAVGSGDSGSKDNERSVSDITAEVLDDSESDDTEISAEPNETETVMDETEKVPELITKIDTDSTDSETLIEDGKVNKTYTKDWNGLKSEFSIRSSDGKAGNSIAEMDKAINEAGYDTKSLTLENIELSDEKTLFKFKFTASETASEMNGRYMFSYTTSEHKYYVICGKTDISTNEEVSRYFSNGNKVVCYGFCVEEEGEYVLLPLFAGSEENGYYVIRPVIEAMGYDLSDMDDMPKDAVIGSPIN